MTRYDYRGNVRAPEFPADIEWLNTGRRLSLAELRGKFVLLDFWTYGCINCIHVIPDLKRLEALYPNELVVIGVHSAKFANEGDSANLRETILRYGLEHPVINDAEMRVWRAYAVRAWPTTVLIDPRGYVIDMHAGEGVLAAFADELADALPRYDADGLVDRTPLAVVLERSKVTDGALRYPGKLLADEAGGRLFIADSGHNRVLITDLEGVVHAVVGSGARGLADGHAAEAQFVYPQGLALDAYTDTLYVADTENHAIRAIDLHALRVRTLAGDGTQGRHIVRPGRAAATALNSPWDLALVGQRLYIAMAGPHQLWLLDLGAGTIGPYAGTGAEALVDAPLAQASLAQPSGITTDGHVLYFADSESSAIRSADLDPTGGVHTLIGQGLFDFGDEDGGRRQARLQHPLGVTWYQGRLYVADTYNHRIKIVEPAEKRVRTLVGGGRGNADDEAGSGRARFYEPSGLSGAGGRLYVADTNNHAVRVIDLASARVSTLALQDPQGRLAA
ncbi:MAG: redoxin domain-containing protein [Chloroflexi bacterium]|nr:redoxin domain-containing protein [Chloroflexota bacterium]